MTKSFPFDILIFGGDTGIDSRKMPAAIVSDCAILATTKVQEDAATSHVEGDGLCLAFYTEQQDDNWENHMETVGAESCHWPSHPLSHDEDTARLAGSTVSAGPVSSCPVLQEPVPLLSVQSC